MIRVTRSRAAPSILSDPDSKGAKETEEAKTRFAPKVGKKAHRKKAKKFEFKVYRSDDVKRALNELFHGKCAYCESRYGAVQPMDVEHWRPKSIYYWLAADWNNLLPSCIDCNRKRKQMDEREKKKRSSGKGTQFPVADPDRRWIHHLMSDPEDPLLLNPCTDWPEKHIEFFDDQEALVRSRRNSRKGLESINIYGLNRTGLVLERKERLLRLKASLFTIDILAKVWDHCSQAQEPMIETLLEREAEVLERSLKEEQPYAQMARQLIGPSKKSWKRFLKKK